MEPVDRKSLWERIKQDVVEIAVLFCIILPYLLIFDYLTGRWNP